MPGLFYPLSRPEDYQAFKAILGDDIPDSFDEWVDRIAKERAQQRLEWEHLYGRGFVKGSFVVHGDPQQKDAADSTKRCGDLTANDGNNESEAQMSMPG